MIGGVQHLQRFAGALETAVCPTSSMKNIHELRPVDVAAAAVAQ